MTKPATIDVLIPVYDGARFVAASIDSLLAQTFRDIRILLIDDGSTDDTPAILRDYAARDARVEVELAPHRGVGPTLNALLDKATAPYIARQDHDDLSYPERLERQLRFLQERPDYIAVSARHRLIDGEDRVLGEAWEPPPVEKADPTRLPALEPYLAHTLLLVRRDALVAVGGYRDLDHTQDVDLYWRLLPLGGMTNLPDTLGDYRIHGTSVSGLSIVHGRIQAVTSQLAAISAQRRQAGRQDLSIPPGLTATLVQRGTLSAMLDFFAPGLTPAEQLYLAAASVLKLMEYSELRPYRLEASDLELAAGLFRRMPFPVADDREAARRRLRGQIKDFFAGRPWARRFFFAARPGLASALKP